MEDRTVVLVLAGVGALLLLQRVGTPSPVGGSPTMLPPSGGGGAPAPGGSGGLVTPATVPTTGPILNPTPLAVPTTLIPPPVATPNMPAPLPTAQQLIVPPITVALLGGAALATSQSTTLAEAQSLIENGVGVVKSGVAVSQQISTDPATIADLGTVLAALGIASLVFDIGFTIAGDAPNAVKAIDSAFDTAAIGVIIAAYALSETGIGFVVGIVLTAAKFIFDLFAGKLFGGLTHAQRQALETARYAQNLHPIFPEIATAYSPRELLRVLIDWGSGSCGGAEPVAMVTGLHNTPSPGVNLFFGAPGCYYNAGGPNAGITFDAMALWLATKGQTADFFASAQAGVEQNILTTFNVEVFNIVTARCVVFANMLAQGLTLDEMDEVASEYRRADTLNRVALIFGWDSWQQFFAALVQPMWAQYVAAHPTGGTLNGFANSLGYADGVALRDAAFAGYLPTATAIMALEDSIAGLETLFIAGGPVAMTATTFPVYTPDAAVKAYLQQLDARVAAVETAVANATILPAQQAEQMTIQLAQAGGGGP